MTRSCNNIGAYDNTTTKNVSCKGGVISKGAFYFGPSPQKNTNKSLSLYVFTFGGKNMRDNSGSFVQRQKRIAIYHVKKFVKESQL